MTKDDACVRGTLNRFQKTKNINAIHEEIKLCLTSSRQALYLSLCGIYRMNEIANETADGQRQLDKLISNAKQRDGSSIFTKLLNIFHPDLNDSTKNRYQNAMELGQKIGWNTEELFEELNEHGVQKLCDTHTARKSEAVSSTKVSDKKDESEDEWKGQCEGDVLDKVTSASNVTGLPPKSKSDRDGSKNAPAEENNVNFRAGGYYILRKRKPIPLAVAEAFKLGNKRGVLAFESIGGELRIHPLIDEDMFDTILHKIGKKGFAG